MFISILLIFVRTEYSIFHIYTVHLGVGWLSMIINVLPRYSRHTAIIYRLQAVRVGEGKVNCIHSTWGRAVKFYVETKYDLDPHRAASNPAQVSSAPAVHQALAGR